MFLTNHSISNLISKINYGVQKRLRFLNIEKNNLNLKLLEIFYKNGIIRSYRIIKNNKISIYFKYYLCNKVFFLKTISTPGHRENWKLNKLLRIYNKQNFSGLYIISTQKGLLTSDKCILNNFISGEILIKIEV